jgi:hypothetical protein
MNKGYHIDLIGSTPLDPEISFSQSILQNFFLHSQNSIWSFLALSGCTQSIFQIPSSGKI